MHLKIDNNQRLIMIANSYSSIINFRLPLINLLFKKGIKLTLTVFNLSEVEKKHLEDITECEVFSVNFGRGYNSILTDLFSLFKLMVFMQKRKFTFVVSFMVKPIFITWIIKKLLRHEQINVFEGLGFLSDIAERNRFSHFIVTYLYKAMTRNAKNIVLNEADLQFFNKLGVRHVIKIPGIGIKLERYRDITSTRNECIQFAFAGRLIKSKGILCYLEAARIVSTKVKNVDFHIFGSLDDNPSAVSPTELKSYLALSNIKLHGYVDMREALQLVDVLVIPSKREGFSVVLMEAFASGTPVIGANVPGVKDAILNEVNGILFETENVEELVEKLLYVVYHPEIIEIWGINARDYALINFDCEKKAELFLNVINTSYA